MNGSVNPDAAWYYPHPGPAARQIRDHVAFWHGVKIVKAGDREDSAARGGLAARLRSMFSA